MRRFSLNPIVHRESAAFLRSTIDRTFFTLFCSGRSPSKFKPAMRVKTSKTHPAKRQLAKRHKHAALRAKSSGNAPNQGHEARVHEEQVPYFTGAREPFRFLEFFAGGGMARAGLAPSWASIWANDFSASKASIYRKNWGITRISLGRRITVSALSWPAS